MRSDRDWTIATVRYVRDIADGVREIGFSPKTGAGDYPSGSHVAVHVQIDGKQELRYYSLVGARPINDTWRIAVHHADNSRGGSRYMWSLKEGYRFPVAAPDSNFKLSQDPKEVLLIAGGIGITPIVGLTEALMASKTSFRLLYAGRSKKRMAFVNELGDLVGTRMDLYVSDEGKRLNLPEILATLKPSTELYVCGPFGMLDEVRRLWNELGRSKGHLVYETFGSSGHAQSEPFIVKIPGRLGDITVRADQSLLDALNNSGIHVLGGCLRGECGLCAVDVVDVNGLVDHRDLYFSDDQHAEGKHICTCVSRVVGGSITIDPLYRTDEPLKCGAEVARR